MIIIYLVLHTTRDSYDAWSASNYFLLAGANLSFLWRNRLQRGHDVASSMHWRWKYDLHPVHADAFLISNAYIGLSSVQISHTNPRAEHVAQFVVICVARFCTCSIKNLFNCFDRISQKSLILNISVLSIR